ncbi:glycoside hydrolase family 9 protein [Thermicanus aegyptius]|uniref:glycoside hydrolase family 9 protein n=1 Tax=Thermicanus aegyptius TaxID=94009 RepID=UPI0006864596|nr:glycoside hydrolase family 9 protein [Thermicanus aegyptius]
MSRKLLWITTSIILVTGVLAMIINRHPYVSPENRTGEKRLNQEASISSIGDFVKVDQTGYLPEYPKIAIVVDREGVGSFVVKREETDEIVFSGTLSAAIQDLYSGDTVRFADFSSLRSDGTYYVEVEGVGRSYPFQISAHVYDNLFFNVLRSYTLQRSNAEMNDPVTGLRHKAGHSQDAQAVMYFSDPFHKEGDLIDVSGGWYDAGDFGKYMPSASVTVGQLLLAYELNPDHFSKGQMQFPEGLSMADRKTDMPDLLVEVKYELEWMEKMQRPDGAVYHKVGGKQWPGFILPEEDKQKRYVYGLSHFGTAQYAGAMALAARIYRPFDREIAARLLENAKKAQEYLESHPEGYFRNDPGQNDGSGPYDKYSDQEERFWAAAELFKTTKDPHYEQLIEKQFKDLLAEKTAPVSWNNALALGQWAYLTGETGNAALKDAVKKSFLREAAQILQQIQSDGYRNSLTEDEYVWASAKTLLERKPIVARQSNSTESGLCRGCA